LKPLTSARQLQIPWMAFPNILDERLSVLPRELGFILYA